MATKKTVNSDIYNLSQLVDDVKSAFIPNESDETLAIGTYGYIGALESHRLQTQVQMTGELSNEVFPSRARLERNVITHAIMANIDNINAIPAKISAFLAIKESDIQDYFDSNNVFIVDRECPLYIGDFEFHLEYSVKLKRILIKESTSSSDTQDYYSYTAQYIIPEGREVPTSTITSSNQYLSPPVIIQVSGAPYIYLTVLLAQVEHTTVSRKLVTSSIVDNKMINFEFENQLAYFEIHCEESDQDYYILPVFEGSSVPESSSQYYCWYQYIDTNLIRVRFDRDSYMPGLNTTVECLVKTCQGSSGNFTYGTDSLVTLESSEYGYKNINCLLSPITDSTGGKDRKSKKELQSLIPKENLSRGSLTTITDLNNYFGMIDSEENRIVIQKKSDNQMERVYYAYMLAKDSNNNIIPSNTIDIKVGLEDLIESQVISSDTPRYLLPSGTKFKLGDDGIGYVSHEPTLDTGYKLTASNATRGGVVNDKFVASIPDDAEILVALGSLAMTCDVNGCPTSTYVATIKSASEITFSETMSEANSVTEVEDYIQMGVGNKYIYSIDYIVKSGTDTAPSSITFGDSALTYFNFVSARYSIDSDAAISVSSIPFTIPNLLAGERIHIEICLRLNATPIGLNKFIYNSNTIYETGNNIFNVSDILVEAGITGAVTNTTVSSTDLMLLTDIGTPPTTSGLTGKDYSISFNTDQYSVKSIYFTATVSGTDYKFIIDRDRNTIKNTLYVIEGTVKEEISYTTYRPYILYSFDYSETNSLLPTKVTMNLYYKSISNRYTPTITFKVSNGISYVEHSNIVTYPNGVVIQTEPAEISISDDNGFLYCNPYAANINSYKLYSAFYMMSMSENPYLHFKYVNDASNIQFIATSVYWTRPFSGYESDRFKLNMTITQSAQTDLGLIPVEGDTTRTPLVKAIIVFKRDGSDYRYKTLDISSYDPDTYTINFEQEFISADLFDNKNYLKVGNVQVAGQAEYTVTLKELDSSNALAEATINGGGSIYLLSEFFSGGSISISDIESVTCTNPNALDLYPVYNTAGTTITDYEIRSLGTFSDTEYITITFTDTSKSSISISATCTDMYDMTDYYGFFAPNTSATIYVLCGLPDETGYTKDTISSICPDLDKWTLTNSYDIVNGLTFYHNYSEIMGSRVKPYGTDVYDEETGNTVMNLQGYYINSVPMLGYQYCQDETLVQNAIDALNYRKAYIDSTLELLENSFGIDFKLFNTYGPSKIYYIIRDTNNNGVLDESYELIDKVNLSFYFRIKLVAQNDSYTKDNIIAEIKEYIEDIDEISELHIPNLVTQITTNYKEQISYFEYLGFNDYGATVQHIYKAEDNQISIHTAPEFLNINNTIDNGTITPDINIYISEV